MGGGAGGRDSRCKCAKSVCRGAQAGNLMSIDSRRQNYGRIKSL